MLVLRVVALRLKQKSSFLFVQGDTLLFITQISGELNLTYKPRLRSSVQYY